MKCPRHKHRAEVFGGNRRPGSAYEIWLKTVLDSDRLLLYVKAVHDIKKETRHI